jgi:outer membrane protein OmpA-like peptidoglycan-associated protein
MMKKLIITLVFAVVGVSVSAQNEKKESSNNDFNKWSFELAVGGNKPQRPFSSVNYYTSTLSPLVIDLGFRYMLNNKFGIKADFGYNSFKPNRFSYDFDTKYYRFDVQGVANLGRIMNFESWTNTIGILGHAGFGVARLQNQSPSIKDNMGNFIIGGTLQIKLSNSIALTTDFSTITNFSQDIPFDAKTSTPTKQYNGLLFNGTVGLTFYLGKNEKHADWTVLKNENVLKLEERVSELEKMNTDSDNDGVVDYLDQEPNTKAGTLVDTKGRSLDMKKIFNTYNNNTTNNNTKVDNDSAKSLINDSYVSVFFDFNKTTPSLDSKGSLSYILNYLRNNPTATIDIIGHTDELGGTNYNSKLSEERAIAVKKILIDAKVDASRLNVVSSGIDDSVNKDSDYARRLVRRVTFKIK